MDLISQLYQNVFVKFLANDFMFSFVIILVSFILGWLLYDNIITRGISLRDSLFEKDNFAAWVEFIGAFIFPILFLAAKSVEGSASSNLFYDLLYSVEYAISYVIVFTVLRAVSSLIIRHLGAKDEEGKISLNHEIYIQKNMAASLFSVALSTIFVSIISFFDVIPGFILTSVYKMSVILVLSLLSVIVYCLILRKKTTLIKEIFIDNNIAAGVNLLGFVFAVETILYNAAALQVQFDLFQLAMMSFIGLVLIGILFAFFRWAFCKIIKVDIWNEVYEQNNIGAAVGEIALYIGIASVIVNFMK
jgi:hypothetical protein